MSAKYERTFVVAAPVERAWQAFVDPEEREAWMGTRPAELEPGEMKVDTVEAHRRLSWSESPAGLNGWYETTVTFEEVASGTRITMVRSGFGDSEDWLHFAENTERGGGEAIADLILYLETGVRASRHFPFRSGLGATMLQSGAGVRVTHVVPGGFAAEAGMQAGDLLLRLNGASVVHASDIAFLGREHDPGEEIEADYARGSEVLRGRAALSVWSYGSDEYVGHPGGYPKAALTGAQAAG
ncbi:MAG: PDZ domain-containing protein [Dehalococcoidia bacterium]